MPPQGSEVKQKQTQVVTRLLLLSKMAVVASVADL